MDQKNATIPYTVLTKTIKNSALHSTTPNEKHFIYVLTDQLGGEIRKVVNPFNEEEFMTDCGVKPEWATIAA